MRAFGSARTYQSESVIRHITACALCRITGHCLWNISSNSLLKGVCCPPSSVFTLFAACSIPLKNCLANFFQDSTIVSVPFHLHALFSNLRRGKCWEERRGGGIIFWQVWDDMSHCLFEYHYCK